MHVDLPPDLERVVRRKVESGLYKSPEDVIRTALEVLAKHDLEDEKKLIALRQAIEEGESSEDSTEFTTMKDLLEDDA